MKAPKLSGHALSSIARALTSKEFWTPTLDPLLKERIVLHMSKQNGCAVCSSLHMRRAERLGLSEDEVKAAQHADVAEFDEKTRAALRYAVLRTTNSEASDEGAVRTFEAMYSAEEQAAIRSVIDTFTFNNRFNNTWESLLPGAEARRKKIGIV
jgi:AhpD family alkylhydroperoxidase